ncbi:MAG: DUF3226 domain-containing protein [Pseudomonadota bacterium]
MPATVNRGFETTCFLLTEGKDDAGFFRGLIKARNLGEFDVRPNYEMCGQGGNTGFSLAMRASESQTGFDRIRHTVLIADNDSDPEGSFAEIKRQVREAAQQPNAPEWAIIEKPYEKAEGSPCVTSVMLPSIAAEGSLETLIWPVVEETYPELAQDISQTLTRSGAIGWPISKRDKARMRMFIASRVRRDPALPLSQLWGFAPELIPLESPVFDPICEFLAQCHD